MKFPFFSLNVGKINFSRLSFPKSSIKNAGRFIKSLLKKETLLAVKFLPKALSIYEKSTITIMLGIIAVSCSFLWYSHWIKTTHEVSNIGGIYVEGIAGEAKDLDKHIDRLINTGLTRIDENGEIKPDLAEKWDISDEGKTYQFTLREGFNSQDLANQLNSKNIWPNTEITTPSDNVIVFKFKQPFNPFLYITTEAVFPYGPYKIIKEEKNKITLQANNDFWQGTPKISKIVFNFYQTQNALDKAVKRGEVMGFFTKEAQASSDFNSYIMNLPRETMAFFNLTRTDLQNVDLRRKLKDGQSADKDYNWVLVTSDNDHNAKLAEDLKNKWAGLKIHLEIRKYSNATLQKDIIPKRDYDILLYGLDYGPDPDPYPFWHSSQNKSGGMNLSNFSNKKADKILEEARQTLDAKVREDKINEFRQILDQEIPFISLEKEKFDYVINKQVKGVNKIYGVSESDRFLNVDKWYIKTKRVKNS